LAAKRQFLPFDVPEPASATVGGSIALNLNGPRRGYYGAVRDLVIGMKVALVSGAQIKAGGKVVKNVAGYDMCKLFTGSLGSLGVITEATLRVAPVPETAASIVGSGSLDSVAAFAARLAGTQLLPAALVISNFPDGEQWRITLACEGSAEHVERHVREGHAIARELALGTELLRDAQHHRIWRDISGFSRQISRCVFRVTVPRGAVAHSLKSLAGIAPQPPELTGDALNGTLWLSWPAEREFISLFPRLISSAASHRGHAVLFCAPPEYKSGIDTWGPAPEGYALMRAIKQQFDPDGLLNAGRFIGGL
jgi:glycolate oxidase FAD binding subunit